MTPRNLVLFRIPPTLNLDALEAGAAECALRELGALELGTRGFVPPYGRDSSEYAPQVGGAFWLTVGGETRQLPPAAVDRELQAKLDAFEEREGRRPGGRTRKRLREEVVTDLLPRALIVPSRVDVVVDPRTGLVAIDTASRKVAENVVSEIRRALGSFPALPLNAEVAPRSVLTAWLAGEALIDGLALGEECELRDPIDQGAIAKLSRTELVENAEVDKHLQSGKQATRLALNLADHVSFVLGEDLVLRKFKLLDGAIDKLESNDTDDVHAELQARLALFVGELRALFTGVLEPAFHISKVES